METDPAQIAEIARLMGSQLIERRDAKAVQKPNGAYNPVREDMRNTDSPLVGWHVNDIIDHVQGKTTYGPYLVKPETNTVRCVAFDIDIRAKARPEAGEEPIFFGGVEIDPRAIWLSDEKTEVRADIGRQLLAMTYGLGIYVKKILDTKVLFSYSGSKGAHVIAVLDEGTPAMDARDAARRVLDATGVIMEEHGDNFFKHVDSFPALQIELFPKQDEVTTDSFGNLMRLPLGVNRKTRKSGMFMMISQDLKVKSDNALTALSRGSLR